MTHVEHTKVPYNETTIDPFQDLESRTTFVGVEYDIKVCKCYLVHLLNGAPTFDQ